MLAQPSSSSSAGSSIPNQAMSQFSVSAASAAASSTLDALLEQASMQQQQQSSSGEPPTFDELFTAASASSDSQQHQIHNITAPSTPQVHDASAFTTMQNFSFDLSTLESLVQAANSTPFTSPMMQDVDTYTPPSASEPPALSFSPTSPYDHSALQATPSTGLTMDMVDFEGDMGDMPLFGFTDNFDINRTLFGDESGDMSGVEPSALGLKGVAPQPQVIYQSVHDNSAQMADLEGLIAMSGTPSVVPVPLSAQLSTTSLPNTSSSTTTSSSSPVSTRRPTGHRKNLAPSALLPVDAPTQPRSYRGPSATSRKDIPAFALASSSTPLGPSSSSSATASASSTKKRKAVSQDPEDSDDDDEEKFKPRMGESEIEAKRRQNTLAARRSRHRKLAYVRELEEKVVGLMRENERMRETIVGAGLEFEW